MSDVAITGHRSLGIMFVEQESEDNIAPCSSTLCHPVIPREFFFEHHRRTQKYSARYFRVIYPSHKTAKLNVLAAHRAQRHARQAMMYYQVFVHITSFQRSCPVPKDEKTSASAEPRFFLIIEWVEERRKIAAMHKRK